MTMLYVIPGAAPLDQLASPTLDGQPDENARENCLAASIAEALNILVAGGARRFVPDELHDAVYGQGYVGPQSAAHYVAYCADHGVRLTPLSGSQSALVSYLHQQVSAGHPCLVTMPSNWSTPYPDPVHPSGYTHVGLAVGCAPGSPGVIRVMNPWHGFLQDESDAWWLPRLCEGQIWVCENARSGIVSNIIPSGWHDANGVLTAPNGVLVRGGFREFVLSYPGGWPAWNEPLAAESGAAQLELSNPALGGGTHQPFKTLLLEWRDPATANPNAGPVGVFTAYVGQEWLALRSALDAANAEIAHLKAQLAAAQAAPAAASVDAGKKASALSALAQAAAEVQAL